MTVRARSYEIRPDGAVGSSTLLNWFQEAAFANSTALGYPPERYQEMGISWVMRESDLEVLAWPRYGEEIAVTTWIAELGRVQAYRQYEARRADGTVAARCNTQWAMLDLAAQRPMRIPAEMLGVFRPARDFVLEPAAWAPVEGEEYFSVREVAGFEEDELAHVNNAQYVNWIEENARRAALAAGLTAPRFRRQWLRYRLAAVKDDVLTVHSRFSQDGLRWEHRIERDGALMLEARGSAASDA